MISQIFEVRRRDGSRYCHCGWERDAINLVEMHKDEGFTYTKLQFLNPQTIDVEAETCYDKELKGQKVLPESELEPLTF